MSQRQTPVALVTGGTRGIGLGIARSLARDGYSLVLGFNSNASAAAAAQDALQREFPGCKVVTVGGDIALAATIDALFAAVEQHFGNRLDAFVHNAGLILGVTSASDSAPSCSPDSDEAWAYFHQVYVLAFKRGLAPALACTGLKHVVAVSAVGCNATQGPVVSYEAPGQAKAALEYLVRLNALKLAGRGINVNCIVPGYTDTDAWSKVAELGGEAAAEALNKRVAATPGGRFARPEEIGDAAAFLCSSRGAFITGVALPVDGGLHLQR